MTSEKSDHDIFVEKTWRTLLTEENLTKRNALEEFSECFLRKQNASGVICLSTTRPPRLFI